jgi:hypothetical protein
MSYAEAVDSSVISRGGSSRLDVTIARQTTTSRLKKGPLPLACANLMSPNLHAAIILPQADMLTLCNW